MHNIGYALAFAKTCSLTIWKADKKVIKTEKSISSTLLYLITGEKKI